MAPAGAAAHAPEPADRARMTPGRWRIVLVVLVLVAFAPFALADLFWDDRVVINPDGPIAELSTIGKAFTGRCVLFPENVEYDFYRPVVDILLILEYAVSGTHPFLYHLTNVLVHLANVSLAFELFRRLAGGTHAVLAAGLGAGLFALHPVQVESVLWPAARPAMLSTLFMQGAMVAAYLAWQRRGEADGKMFVYTAAGGAGVLLGLLSKESGLVFLPAALFLLLHPAARASRPPLMVFGACWVVAIVYTVANQAAGSRVTGIVSPHLLEWIALALQGIGFYAGKLIWPWPLYPAYGQVIFRTDAFLALGGAVTLVMAAVSGLCLWRRRWHGLLVVSGLAVAAGGVSLPLLAGMMDVADRYLYHSLWGLGLVVTVALREPERLRIPAARLLVGGMIALSVMSVYTLRQSARWVDHLSLWQWVHKNDPLSLLGNFNLGMIHERREEYALAVPYYETLLAIQSGSVLKEQARAGYLLGRIYVRAGRFEDALRALEFGRAEDWFGEESKVFTAMALYSLGRHGEARSYYRDYSDDSRRTPDVYINLAKIALFFENDAEAARRWYAMALEKGGDPDAALERALNQRE